MINPSSNRLQPDFLCIGAPKAGTTWLHGNLALHPQVWFTPVKEIHYFDRYYFKDTQSFVEKAQLRRLSRGIQRKIKGEPIDSNYLSFLSNMYLNDQKDDDWYLSLFKDAKPDSVIGDMTPLYCALPEVGVKHIRDLLGDIKIIFIMRNPVKRAWSNVLMTKRSDVKKGIEIADEQWLKMLKVKSRKVRGNYISTIDNYEKYFSNIQYLFYDQVRLDPMGFLKQVCEFLGIEYKSDYFENNVSQIYNKNPKVPIPRAVEDFLIKEYQEQTEWIKAKFNPYSFEL